MQWKPGVIETESIERKQKIKLLVDLWLGISHIYLKISIISPPTSTLEKWVQPPSPPPHVDDGNAMRDLKRVQRQSIFEN